jgi:antitoxin VapB
MGLNVNSPEAQELAAALAQLRNVSVDQAVTDAMREELERQKKRRARASKEELLAIADRIAARIGSGQPSAEAVDELYDENGLPK